MEIIGSKYWEGIMKHMRYISTFFLEEVRNKIFGFMDME
jgi:hypothetical protein